VRSNQLFPQSALRSEIDKRRKQIEKSRDGELRSQVVSLCGTSTPAACRPRSRAIRT
jgi:hypothetical protein